MKLLPLDTPEILELAAGWLAQKENHQWLDFGNARQIITPALLRIMAQRPSHFMRAYTSDRDDTPIGICCLNSVDRNFKSATLWGAQGDKLFRHRGLGTLAASKVLTLAFRDLGLHTINTWVVEGNPSIRLIQRLNFRYIGRQRQCHFMDGRAHDRLLFDLLASEHESFEETRRARKSRSLQDTLRQNGDEDAGAELHSENHPTPLRALATAGSGAGLEIQPG
ncbi:MAG TPA: GNAT family protein [Burkholderiales bacterium]|jgi:RimJ/RimL family protein N-acetyltransferase|nr:GNAT family protein [Burkholderiales bacterium]